MLMCRSCGEFVVATDEDGEWIPASDECPECGGKEFKDTESDTVVRTEAGTDEQESGADTDF